MRDGADRDEDFVRQLAADLGLPFHGHRADVRVWQARYRLSLEEVARQVRYAFFEEVCAANGYAKIALGHHADDNAETLLLHLLRGSGRLGLAGIPAIRAGVTIRPLIFATRSDIAEYLRTRGIPYVSDPTNTDGAFFRNRIRHRLIPDLERDYHPGMRAILSRTALILRAEEEWLDSLVEPIYGSLLTADGEGRVGLSAPALGRLPLAAARRVVRKALIQVKHDLRRVAFAHVEQVLELVRRTTDAGPLHLPGRVHVRRQGDEIIFARTEGAGARPLPDETPHDFEYRLAGCGGLTILETGDCIRLSEVAVAAVPELAGQSPQTAYMDMAAVEFPVTVRNFRPGDRFSPLGMAGTQKLKKYFIDHKVRPGRASPLPAAHQPRPAPVGRRPPPGPPGRVEPADTPGAQGGAVSCETVGSDYHRLPYPVTLCKPSRADRLCFHARPQNGGALGRCPIWHLNF